MGREGGKENFGVQNFGNEAVWGDDKAQGPKPSFKFRQLNGRVMKINVVTTKETLRSGGSGCYY